jgi:hypothetical protein
MKEDSTRQAIEQVARHSKAPRMAAFIWSDGFILSVVFRCETVVATRHPVPCD